MDDYKTVTVVVGIDNLQAESVAGSDYMTFRSWGSRFEFLKDVDLTFDSAKDLVKVINKTIKLSKEEKKKL